MRYDTERLICAADLAGIFVFGIEGALAAIGGGLVRLARREASAWQNWHLPTAAGF